MEECVVFETLFADSHERVRTKWGELAFKVKSVAEREGVARIQNYIADALFPSRPLQTDLKVERAATEHDMELHKQSRPRGGHAKESLDRVLKQVDAIARAIEDGQDARASKFLNDLIGDQLRYTGGEEHVVKSLCNIAVQCKEMFRTDFEFQCLDRAVSLNSEDGWTLIQLADHYKRVGRYEDALYTLNEAAIRGESIVALSSRADVMAHMGKLNEAMAIYDGMSNLQWNAAARTARADVLRRSGDLKAAAQEYDRIIRDGLSSSRVIAGTAEIAKRQGRLAEAKETYIKLIGAPDIDEVSEFVFRMALSNVLMRKGEYREAYRHLDDAVQSRPFSLQARSMRAAVAGILGNPEAALNDIPHLGQTRAFNEWICEYVRGVLLLLLNRYEDAREALLRHVEEHSADRDGHGLLRLGAAVCLLRDRSGLEEAAEVLNKVPELNDALADQVRDTLRYHIAVSLGQKQLILDLESRFASMTDAGLRGVVAAIQKRDWRAAWRGEIQAILRLAS